MTIYITAIFLGKHPAVTPKHLETLYSIICGAAPLSASDIEAVIAKNVSIIYPVIIELV